MKFREVVIYPGVYFEQLKIHLWASLWALKFLRRISDVPRDINNKTEYFQTYDKISHARDLIVYYDNSFPYSLLSR